jgi:DNA-binding transcriptional ArsR family regulator
MIFNVMVEYRRNALLDATYSALAHPVRRSILERLREGPDTVTGVADPFDLSLAAVSKHIGVLEDAALLRRRIDGRVHHLSLEPAPLGEASAWLQTYRAFWEERLDALDALLRRRGSDGRRRR